MTMNRKAQEELEKKQAEAEKLQKVNEVGALFDTIYFLNI
jgi:hypothetical protein